MFYLLVLNSDRGDYGLPVRSHVEVAFGDVARVASKRADVQVRPQLRTKAATLSHAPVHTTGTTARGAPAVNHVETAHNPGPKRAPVIQDVQDRISRRVAHVTQRGVPRVPIHTMGRFLHGPLVRNHAVEVYENVFENATERMVVAAAQKNRQKTVTLAHVKAPISAHGVTGVRAHRHAALVHELGLGHVRIMQGAWGAPPRIMNHAVQPPAIIGSHGLAAR